MNHYVSRDTAGALSVLMSIPDVVFMNGAVFVDVYMRDRDGTGQAHHKPIASIATVCRTTGVAKRKANVYYAIIPSQHASTTNSDRY